MALCRLFYHFFGMISVKLGLTLARKGLIFATNRGGNMLGSILTFFLIIAIVGSALAFVVAFLTGFFLFLDRPVKHS